jgi:hypothetical protein
MKPKPFILTLVPKHQDDDPEGFRRLRFILKRLLRGFSFRCTKIDFGERQPSQEEESDKDG